MQCAHSTHEAMDFWDEWASRTYPDRETLPSGRNGKRAVWGIHSAKDWRSLQSPVLRDYPRPPLIHEARSDWIRRGTRPAQDSEPAHAGAPPSPHHTTFHQSSDPKDVLDQDRSGGGETRAATGGECPLGRLRTDASIRRQGVGTTNSSPTK